MERRLCLLGIFLALAISARADEIRLKDGSKIIGTIVDFQDDSFKVQTPYGFAMVRKDSIAQIIPSEPVKPVSAAGTTPAPAISSASATAVAPGGKPEAQPAVARGAAPKAGGTASLAMPAPNPKAKPAAVVTAVAPAPMPAPISPAATPVPATPPAPPAPPAPVVVRDTVQGTVYANQTYNFQLYRPPGWDLMPEARKAMPNAITAMGTTDETTLFIVGRENLRDTLESHAANAERSLKQIYENYRPGASAKVSVGGVPAVEWHFHGAADGHDWSVTALTIARGNDVFTLLGMTYADSDLIQLRENVIAKIINSMAFTASR